MSNPTENGHADSGAGVARQFLQAITTGDAVTFWGLMGQEGRGYFKGIWFYALGGMTVSTVTLLADDANFLKDALGQIMEELRSSLGDLLFNPQFGQLQHTDSHHASIAVTGTKTGTGETVTDYIPLVLELAQSTDNNSPDMTCWKIDTLKCFNFAKNEPTQ